MNRLEGILTEAASKPHGEECSPRDGTPSASDELDNFSFRRHAPSPLAVGGASTPSDGTATPGESDS